MKKGILTFIVILTTFLNSKGQLPDSGFHQLTGLDTAISRIKPRSKLRSYIAPIVLMSYGLVSLTGDNAVRRLDYSTYTELREDFPRFTHKLDDYSRYAPAIAVYGLDMVGVKARNNVLDRSIMLLSSYAIVSLSVGTVKGVSNRIRPNGSNGNSFPSGHTSVAFMTAEFLHQEYKDQSVWYSIGGYAIATGTGVLRLYNNAHWVSDVVAGAGFGILSTKLVYLIYPYIKQKNYHGKSPDMRIGTGFQNGKLNIKIIKSFK